MKTYFGVNIYPADMNSSGIRWVATYEGEKLRADTLSGIKSLIKNRVKNPKKD